MCRCLEGKSASRPLWAELFGSFEGAKMVIVSLLIVLFVYFSTEIIVLIFYIYLYTEKLKDSIFKPKNGKN